MSRVMNLCEAEPNLDHDKFCQALENEFAKKWSPVPVNSTFLTENEMRKIP